MGMTKNRKTRRNHSRPAAINFLTNISLSNAANTKESVPFSSFQYPSNANNDLLDGPNYHEHPLDQGGGGPSDIAAFSLHSSDSSSTDGGQATIPMEQLGHPLQPTSSFLTTAPVDNDTPQTTTLPTRKKQDQRRRSSSDSSHEHHKLTREDSERPIASEKIKKKSSLVTDGCKEHGTGGGNSIISVFRYYTGKIKQSTTSKHKHDLTATSQVGYVQQQLANNDHHKRRAGLSYAHFLSPIGTLLDDSAVQEQLDEYAYDPLFLDNNSYNQIGRTSNAPTSSNRSGDARKELNEEFRRAHPEIPSEITLTKIQSIKSHLLEIGKVMDLEASTLAHAYVYFEKLVIKNVVTKKNRKLIAACCLFLAFKVNEAKGVRCHSLLEAIDDELNEDAEDVHGHEFAVFADLEFNLYIPRREFMPHFERIFGLLETKSLASYLGDTSFYQVQQH